MRQIDLGLPRCMHTTGCRRSTHHRAPLAMTLEAMLAKGTMRNRRVTVV